MNGGTITSGYNHRYHIIDKQHRDNPIDTDEKTDRQPTYIDKQNDSNRQKDRNSD